MSRFQMLALRPPRERCKDGYDEGYQQYHLPQTYQIPGILRAQRYQQGMTLQRGYKRNDFGTVHGAIVQATKEGKLLRSDAADRAGAYTVNFGEHGERVTHDQAKARVASR